MNFYNPYYMPYTNISRGIFGNLGRINFSSILSEAQKTLNFVNQAIPVMKEISPMVKNAKTMFKVMNEFNKTDTKVNKAIVQEETNTINNGPTFFY